jgi:hypothetical protein
MAMSLTISRRLALAAAATLAAAGAALAQQDGQIVTAQDIARACQRTHRNPQATAEPTTVGRYGIELNCRLINAAGFTLARVAPEEVCEMLTGRRDWYRGDGTQVICRGTPVALNAPGPAPAPGGPGGGGGGGGGGAGGGGAGGGGGGGAASGDVPLSLAQIGSACASLHNASGATAQVKWVHWFEPVITCQLAGAGAVTVTPEQICPRVTGATGWYVGEHGSRTGVHGLHESIPGVTCRGTGPRQFIALAHIHRYCKARGFAFGNTGLSSGRSPVCAHERQPPAISFQAAAICQEQFGSAAVEARGWLHWCRP